jgi:hypothetical protein
MQTQKISVQLLTLSACLHEHLTEHGVSTVRVLQSINAHLGKLQCTKGGEASLGAGKIVGKGLIFRQTENLGTAQFEGAIDIVGEFKAYNDGLAKLEKQFGRMELKQTPVRFHDWLAKHMGTVQNDTEEDVPAVPARRNGKVPA